MLLGSHAGTLAGMSTLMSEYTGGIPPEQIGWEHSEGQSSVLNRDNVAPRQSFTSVPKPYQLGRLPDFDPTFAELNADRGALPGDHLPDPAGPWNPMWEEPAVQLAQLGHRHKMQMEGYHDLADELQHGETFYTYGNHAAPYNMDIEQPTPNARSHDAFKVHSPLGM